MIRYWQIILDELNEKGLSQADLARELDIRRSVIHNWIKYDRYPKADQSHKISVFLSLSESLLFAECKYASSNEDDNGLTVSESESEYTINEDPKTTKEMQELLKMLKELDVSEFEHIKGIVKSLYSSKINI